MRDSRLRRIAKLACDTDIRIAHCGECGVPADNQDLLMEDLEQRIDSAVEAVRDAAAILEHAGMDRAEAVRKLMEILEAETGGEHEPETEA